MDQVYDVMVKDTAQAPARIVETVATSELAEQLAQQLRTREEDRPLLAWWVSRQVEVER